MSQYIKIKESQMESPMKNMPCHEDPKQRNVGPTIAESHFSKSNFFRSTFFKTQRFLTSFFTNSTFFDIRVPIATVLGSRNR